MSTLCQGQLITLLIWHNYCTEECLKIKVTWMRRSFSVKVTLKRILFSVYMKCLCDLYVTRMVGLPLKGILVSMTNVHLNKAMVQWPRTCGAYPESVRSMLLYWWLVGRIFVWCSVGCNNIWKSSTNRQAYCQIDIMMFYVEWSSIQGLIFSEVFNLLFSSKPHANRVAITRSARWWGACTQGRCTRTSLLPTARVVCGKVMFWVTIVCLSVCSQGRVRSEQVWTDPCGRSVSM